MIGLIPTERWEYTLSDLVRGVFAALLPTASKQKTKSADYINIPEIGRCLPIRSARAAIVLALKALPLKPGASVAVPLYTCPVLLRAIKEAGFQSKFIDVDASSYCMSASDLATKSLEVDAIIAVHMFGNMCDMPALRKVAPNKPIIEDCAQAIGSRLDARIAGSFGDIAVFSFRSGKYLSAGEGGAIHASNAAIRARLEEEIAKLPAPGRAEELTHVLSTWLRSTLRTKPFWGLVGAKLWSSYTKKTDTQNQAQIVLGQIFVTDRRAVSRRMPSVASMIENHRRNSEHYLRVLTVEADMLCNETPGAFFNRLQFPLLVPTVTQCDRLVERLNEDQVSTARPYKDIVKIATAHYGYRGDCPQSERIAETVMVIPCNYALTKSEIQRISEAVNRNWKEMMSHQSVAAAQSDTVTSVRPSEKNDFERVAEHRRTS